jgi:hypothetical protein
MPRTREHDGVVFRRKESRIWWIRYRDRNGTRRRESTFTADWDEAQKRLRDRLQSRDDNVLEERRVLEFWAMGGSFLGKLFQATHAS